MKRTSFLALGTLPFFDRTPALVPIRADVDRIVDVTVCTRPFRARGPRIELETVARKLVVHNYGHGGSGWSLSWGAADIAVGMLAHALGSADRKLAVIGCGAIGITTALTAQRAGFRTSLYAKDLPPFVRSSRATGTWTPTSRIALKSAVDTGFADTWEQMARTAMAMHRSYVGGASEAVEWNDRYRLSDRSPQQRDAYFTAHDHHGFVDYEDRIGDLETGALELGATGDNPFPMRYVRRSSALTFNIAAYQRTLMADFLAAGGTIARREFASPAEIAALPHDAVANCTGYAARALWSDESITPVRGQIAWLPPQDGLRYSLNFDDLYVVARRDAIAVQPAPDGDDTGWNDPNETPDHAAAEAGVARLRAFYGRFSTSSSSSPS